jgi:hypothetical protein
MRTATIHELKEELSNTPAAAIAALCLRMAKYKKENKELLTYLLFEAHDEQGYVQSIKKEVEELFAEMNQSNVYFAKKTLRKILRTINKHIRYTGSAQATVELLIHFCTTLKTSGIPIAKNTVIANLYKSQVQKIHKSLEALHEDLQFDYAKQVEALEL